MLLPTRRENSSCCVTSKITVLRESKNCITLLNNNSIKPEFHFCSFHDPFFHCTFSNEPEHMDLLLLTNTMGTVLDNTTTAIVTTESWMKSLHHMTWGQGGRWHTTFRETVLLILLPNTKQYRYFRTGRGRRAHFRDTNFRWSLLSNFITKHNILLTLHGWEGGVGVGGRLFQLVT